MNSAGFKNSDGKAYSEGERGIGTFLSFSYEYLQKNGDQEGADMIENSFTNKDGKKHYE